MNMSMEQRPIVVLGAGVSGLTTALLLSYNPVLSITIIAKHHPGDYDIEYASPWAGADYAPVSANDTPEAEYDRKTWPELFRLTKVPEAGVHVQDEYVYFRDKDAATEKGQRIKKTVGGRPWYADTVPNFRTLSKDQIPPGVDSGIAYTSVCINTPQYLHYLLGQCVKNGVTIKRGIVKHIADAAKLHASNRPAEVIANCTGLSSAKLGGVEDAAMHPIRGHVVLVRNDGMDRMVGVSGTDDGSDESLYIMKRAIGGGTIIGGTYQIGQTDPKPDMAQGERMLKRAVKLCPELADGKGFEALDVVRHAVGLRPARHGGVRVEAERKGSFWVVHNYGHGGAGYQSSYGTAFKAVELVNEALQKPAAPRL